MLRGESRQAGGQAGSESAGERAGRRAGRRGESRQAGRQAARVPGSVSAGERGKRKKVEGRGVHRAKIKAVSHLREDMKKSLVSFSCFLPLHLIGVI